MNKLSKDLEHEYVTSHDDFASRVKERKTTPKLVGYEVGAESGVESSESEADPGRIGQSAHCIVNTMCMKYSTNGNLRQRERKAMGSSKRSWKKKLSEAMKYN